MRHKTPPMVKDADLPSDLLGSLFNPFCMWIQQCAGKGGQPKLKDDDAARMSECLEILEDNGYVVGSPRTGGKLNAVGGVIFSQRVMSATDQMFNDNNSYGGVPPLSQLKTMSKSECSKLFYKAWRGMG